MFVARARPASALSLAVPFILLLPGAPHLTLGISPRTSPTDAAYRKYRKRSPKGSYDATSQELMCNATYKNEIDMVINFVHFIMYNMVMQILHFTMPLLIY